MSIRSKTLLFQRAFFNEGFNGTLETIIRNTFKALPRVQDRIVEVDLLSRQLFASFEDTNLGKGIFLRILEFEMGAIGVINLDTANSSAAVDEFFHPDKQDFLKDQIIILIVDNKVLACNVKNKGRLLSSKIIDLAQKADVLGRDVKLHVSDVPDEATIEKIRRVGVKKVNFGVTGLMENLDIRHETGSIGRLAMLLFGMPSNGAQIKRHASTVARLTLSRGRVRKEELSIDEWLTQVGIELSSSGADENYTIILNDKSEISNSKLRKIRKVKLPRHANTFSFDHAKAELESYYRDLVSEKSIEA